MDLPDALMAAGVRAQVAIDQLLVAAHLAYLVLVMMADLAKRGRTTAARELMRRLAELLRCRFARPPEMTLGRFLRLIAMDFPNPRLAGVA